MKHLKCFLSTFWFRVGQFASLLDFWENQPEWFTTIWMPLYQYAMGKSYFIDLHNNCGNWREEGKDQ